MTGTIQKPMQLMVGSTNGTIPAGETHITNFSASVPTGRTFLCWVMFVSAGWVGSVYPSSAAAKSPWIWMVGSTSTSDRNFTGYYLYY